MQTHTFKAKTHIPEPKAAQNADGTPNKDNLRSHAAEVAQAFESGKETMLNQHRMVLHDGSVVDMFHHKAAG